MKPDPVLEWIRDRSSKEAKIERVVLFGSRARGDQNERSDYDLAIFASKMDHREWSLFSDQVKQGVPTLCGIDLIHMSDTMSSQLKAKIESEGIPILFSIREKFSWALKNLERSISSPITEPRDLSGILKDFEMAFERSWKALKSQLFENGHQIHATPDIYFKAFQLGMIPDQTVWLEMIDDRNLAAHVYDEADAGKIKVRIEQKYIHALKKLDLSLPIT